MTVSTETRNVPKEKDEKVVQSDRVNKIVSTETRNAPKEKMKKRSSRIGEGDSVHRDT